jgi:hypothetical protein
MKNAMKSVLNAETIKDKRYYLMEYLFKSILTETRKMSEEEAKDFLQRKLESLQISAERDNERSSFWLSGRIAMVEAAISSLD